MLMFQFKPLCNCDFASSCVIIIKSLYAYFNLMSSYDSSFVRYTICLQLYLPYKTHCSTVINCCILLSANLVGCKCVFCCVRNTVFEFLIIQIFHIMSAYFIALLDRTVKFFIHIKFDHFKRLSLLQTLKAHHFIHVVTFSVFYI